MRDVQRAIRRHRALLSGGLVAAAVALALPTLAPAPAATVLAVAAAHDLGAGSSLTNADVTLVALPRSVAPQGILTSTADVVGRAVAGRVRRGEPLTDVRLLGAALVDDASLVAAAVRLADPAVASLLQAGDHVDVLATPAQSPGQARAVTVAQDLRVLAVPGGDDADGALVVLAATPHVAALLAGAAVGNRLSITVLAP